MSAEIKGNKGEWSELYAFLKILNDGKIIAAGENLEPMTDKVFTVKQISRGDKSRKVNYVISEIDNYIHIFDHTGEHLKIVPKNEFQDKIIPIFKNIVEGHESGAFPIPEASEVMDTLLCKTIKAPSTNKEDLRIIINDRLTNIQKEQGFSIKSMAGNASTLLNAGATTNFVFEIQGFTGNPDAINLTEGRSKIQKRIQLIKENGGSLVFNKVFNNTFQENIEMIESTLPSLLAEMLIIFYGGEGSKIKDVVIQMALNTDKREVYYEHKMKNFLEAIAVGMVPSRVRSGETVAEGGYIIVKQDGEVVCYHSYNRDEFLEYLYMNTRFETASSSRHNFGKIYSENGKLYINLNLQIRFL